MDSTLRGGVHRERQSEPDYRRCWATRWRDGEDSVEGEATGGADEKGVEVEALNAAAIVAAKRERKERAVREGCGMAAEASDRRSGRDRPRPWRKRLGLVEGGGAKDHVLAGLDEDAARART